MRAVRDSLVVFSFFVRKRVTVNENVSINRLYVRTPASKLL